MDFFNNSKNVRRRNKASFLDWLLYCLMLFLSGYLFIYGALESGYRWHWQKAFGYLAEYNFSTDEFYFKFGLLFDGLFVTFELSFWAFLIAFGIGISSALLRSFAGPLCRLSVFLYVELIRNTPLLVQLYLAYMASYYFNVSGFTAAVVALGLFEGAYISEIMRAGLGAVSNSQREAAYSLGLNKVQTELLIVFPQAFKISRPALLNQAITLIKDSSLASAIAVMELTKTAQIIVSDTYLVFEIWLLTAFLYLCVAFLLEQGLKLKLREPFTKKFSVM
ncbi:amino acid ABC transporter permease [Desulfovibrio litoralis]|uniref:Amino acid ABC transporter membrane protein 1, PAAT family n=1 Tax=Desulfovibrio litoralis DSM 11393 TaxID=1121455 RepID=A0A1M7T6R7_9BACT|nr:amino acid ABC transporter permease [Desulfovibrio litoralis]SHN66396.1 amino acid ABC transporter membrane protein 1, PAAT family [Desulfovibrio litoralis DSM 11393]